jgi:hypothetical protein
MVIGVEKGCTPSEDKGLYAGAAGLAGAGVAFTGALVGAAGLGAAISYHQTQMIEE